MFVIATRRVATTLHIHTVIVTLLRTLGHDIAFPLLSYNTRNKALTRLKIIIHGFGFITLVSVFELRVFGRITQAIQRIMSINKIAIYIHAHILTLQAFIFIVDSARTKHINHIGSEHDYRVLSLVFYNIIKASTWFLYFD